MQIDIHENYENIAREKGNESSRRQNPMFFLRAFNNWLKSVLITESAQGLKARLKQELDLKVGEQLLHVLDIGCGKGGDIEKWASAGVRAVVGVDFSSESLVVYRERLNKKSRRPFKSILVCRDCGASPSDFFQGFKGIRFDIVSAQFSMHYSFDTKERAKNLICNVANQLLAGGLLIATIPDAYTICKKVFQEKNRQADGSFLYNNKHVALRFQPPFQDTPFGMEYSFFMEGSLGKREGQDIAFVKEWLIDLDTLEQLLEKAGCRMRQTCNFIDFYTKYKDKYKQQMHRFGLVFEPGQAMPDQFWEDVHLYRIVVAEKVAGSEVGDYAPREREAMTSGLSQRINF